MAVTSWPAAKRQSRCRRARGPTAGKEGIQTRGGKCGSAVRVQAFGSAQLYSLCLCFVVKRPKCVVGTKVNTKRRVILVAACQMLCRARHHVWAGDLMLLHPLAVGTYVHVALITGGGGKREIPAGRRRIGWAVRLRLPAPEGETGTSGKNYGDSNDFSGLLLQRHPSPPTRNLPPSFFVTNSNNQTK